MTTRRRTVVTADRVKLSRSAEDSGLEEGFARPTPPDVYTASNTDAVAPVMATVSRITCHYASKIQGQKDQGKTVR